jgi:hypothetical protein
MSSFGDWLPGAKEAKTRAEAVLKRRTAATALTTDLDLDLQDLQVSFELAEKDYQPGDLADFRTALERAQSLMAQIYNDVSMIADNPVPERITDGQAFELVQPALRIEARAQEVRKVFEKAHQVHRELSKPRENAAGMIAEAEQRRLQTEIALTSCRTIAQRLKAAYSEVYPKVEAALLTAESETQAANQMVTSSRQALNRRSWREAHDLARRSITLFESASGKFDLIRQADSDYGQAAQEADDVLAAALRRLNEVRATLTSQAALLTNDPNYYLSAGVQRLGEARRAYKANPPQYVTALNLAKEATALLDQAVIQANDEIEKLRRNRQEARQNLALLNEAVQNLRITINSQRSVPTKATRYYEQARAERTRLAPREAEIDRLSLPQLVELATAARQALQAAQEGLKLVGQ